MKEQRKLRLPKGDDAVEARLRKAAMTALVAGLESQSEEIRKASLKIYADRAAEKVVELQNQLDAITNNTTETVARTEYETVLSTNSAILLQMDSIKKSIALVSKEVNDAAEVKVRDAGRRIADAERNYESRVSQFADFKQAFVLLLELAKISNSPPPDFFTATCHNALYWMTWFEDLKAKKWCAWIKKNETVAALLTELHIGETACGRHGNMWAHEFSALRTEYIHALLKSRGVEDIITRLFQTNLECKNSAQHASPLSNEFSERVTSRARDFIPVVGDAAIEPLPDYL